MTSPPSSISFITVLQFCVCIKLEITGQLSLPEKNVCYFARLEQGLRSKWHLSCSVPNTRSLLHYFFSFLCEVKEHFLATLNLPTRNTLITMIKNEICGESDLSLQLRSLVFCFSFF